jgi:hypothetical protein
MPNSLASQNCSITFELSIRRTAVKHRTTQ